MLMQTSYIIWTWVIEGRPRATIATLFMFTFRGILGYSTQLPLPQVNYSFIPQILNPYLHFLVFFFIIMLCVPHLRLCKFFTICCRVFLKTVSLLFLQATGVRLRTKLIENSFSGWLPLLVFMLMPFDSNFLHFRVNQ